MRLNDRKTKIFSNTHHNFFDLETIALGTSGASRPCDLFWQHDHSNQPLAVYS